MVCIAADQFPAGEPDELSVRPAADACWTVSTRQPASSRWPCRWASRSTLCPLLNRREALAENGDHLEPLPAGRAAPRSSETPPSMAGASFRPAIGLVDRVTGGPAAGLRHPRRPVPGRPACRLSAQRNGVSAGVCLPNPFYAAYEGAAVMAGGEPVFLDCERRDRLPARSRCAGARHLLDRTALFYFCSPSNPQGAVARYRLSATADRIWRGSHGFILAIDECYAEIYDSAHAAGAGWKRPPAWMAACWTICWSSTPCRNARAPRDCVSGLRRRRSGSPDRTAFMRLRAILFRRRHAAAGPGGLGRPVAR